MDDAKQKLADKLKSANNILVTVSRDPSVDQLSALLGLTLLLNKQGKHAVAVFSGQVPSTIEFLKPDETIEKNTDSLRDFIIALDKNKADKLRYKVEDSVVRIFITPYKTSISEADFNFSQGDFNVDVVVALGVRRQEELDEAITAHGRILHDATVASVDIASDSDLGTISWHVPRASSLSELVTDLGQTLGSKLIDEQIATALLTGIVSATNRFSNDKTSSQTMSMSAILMAAGANQQLVTSKLAEMAGGEPAALLPTNPPTDSGSSNAASDSQPPDDGAIEIDHNVDQAEPDDLPEVPSSTPPDQPPLDQPPPGPGAPETPAEPEPPSAIQPDPKSNLSPGSRMITEPPTLGGTLTANSSQPLLDPTTDPLSLPSSEPPQLLDHQTFQTPSTDEPPLDQTPASQPPAGQPPATSAGDDGATLAQLEKKVESPHLDYSSLDNARTEVDQAINSAPDTAAPEPIQALHAQPLGDELHPSTTSGQVVITPDGSLIPAPSSSSSLLPIADNDVSPPAAEPSAPPPVPPPIPFQFGSPPSSPA